MQGTALVSGGSGFAGRYLVDHLRSLGTEVVAPSREELDFRDRDAVGRMIAAAQPAAVFHLAAFSSPIRSRQEPVQAVLGNLEMTLNVLEETRRKATEAVLVLVGSSQIYGRIEDAPAVEEQTPLRPKNPYAVSKASADMLGEQYAAGFGMRVMRMRPFNHFGPGQSPEYVLSSIARQIAVAEAAGARECLLLTGDPASARDFTDVRDIVRAYVLATNLEPSAYNVCRGRATPVSKLIELASRYAEIAVRHEVDESLLRTGESRVVFGSAERLRAACGWRPEIPIERTVHETLAWWRERVHRERA